uniref:Ankyrin repeat protein n=1 Tax=Peronospora matthiolae TaxID=2874970 RepID=A0AAV1VEF3_9STRA
MTNGTTTLHEAAANGSILTVKVLVEHKAQREKTMAELLRQSGCDKRWRCYAIDAVLSHEQAHRDERAAGGRSSAVVDNGLTVLHVAAQTVFSAAVQGILTYCSEDVKEAANLLSDADAKPLQVAAGMEHHEIVTLLKPISEEFDDAGLDKLVVEEKAKLDAYDEQAAKNKNDVAAVEAKEPDTAEEKLEAETR